MTGRIQTFSLALLAALGLVLRQGGLVVHAHEGGDDPHDHACHHGPVIVTHVHHDGQAHSHGVDPEPPAPPGLVDDEGPALDSSDGDGDVHAHAAPDAAALRRASPVGPRTIAGSVPACERGAGSGTAVVEDVAAVWHPPPGSERGHAPIRVRGTTQRRIQGMGLLF